MKEEKKNFIQGAILAFASTLAYSSGPTVLKLTYRTGLNNSSVLFCRHAIALVMAVIPVAIRKRKFRITKSEGLGLLMIGLLAGASSLLYNISYQELQGIVATALTIIYAVFVLVIEMAIRRIDIMPKRVVAVLIAITGIAVICLPGLALDISIKGVALCLMATVAYAFQVTIINSNTVKKIDVDLIFIATNIPILIIVTVSSIISHSAIMISNINQLISVLALSVVNIYIARMTFFTAVKKIGASSAAMINLTEPFFSALFGYVTLNERISPTIGIGTMIIVIAVLFVN